MEDLIGALIGFLGGGLLYVVGFFVVIIVIPLLLISPFIWAEHRMFGRLTCTRCGEQGGYGFPGTAGEEHWGCGGTIEMRYQCRSCGEYASGKRLSLGRNGT